MGNFQNEPKLETNTHAILEEAYDVYIAYLEANRKALTKFETEAFPKDDKKIKEKFENMLSKASVSYCHIGTESSDLLNEMRGLGIIYSEKIRTILVKYRKALIFELKESLNDIEGIKDELEIYVDSTTMEELRKLKSSILSSNIVSFGELNRLKQILNIPISKTNEKLVKLHQIIHDLIHIG